jgi:hypothetical protein
MTREEILSQLEKLHRYNAYAIELDDLFTKEEKREFVRKNNRNIERLQEQLKIKDVQRRAINKNEDSTSLS